LGSTATGRNTAVLFAVTLEEYSFTSGLQPYSSLERFEAEVKSYDKQS
jgi:hypothetical protein